MLWTGPVHATKECFESIRPYIDPRRTAVGTIFAQGLIHLLAHRTFGPEVRFFALRNIPWLCRTVKHGEESQIVGPKSSIGIMCMNLDEEWVKARLEPLFVVQKTGRWEPVIDVLPDFCPIVFNPQTRSSIQHGIGPCFAIGLAHRCLLIRSRRSGCTEAWMRLPVKSFKC